MRIRTYMHAAALLLTTLVAFLLIGCGMGKPTAGPVSAAGLALHGKVHGGQQPVSNSQIELFAAGTSGSGSAQALLKHPVFTDGGGNWSITQDYTCPSGSSEIYLMAIGGNPGLANGTNNTAIVLVTALGQCVNLSSSTFIIVNEVTTVAAAYALAGFTGTNEAFSSSSTNTVGLQNAFDTFNNLVDISTGEARLTTPGGHGIVPQEEINSLADILAACVNTDNYESLQCLLLYNNTIDADGNLPTDVFLAAINLAHFPTQAVDPLVHDLVTADAPFQPTLSVDPTDWTLGVVFYGGGMGYPNNIAIDALGNVWVSGSTQYNGFLSKLSPQGVPLSPAVNAIGFGGFDLGNVGAGPIAIDSKGNVWMPNTQVVTGYQGGGVVKLDNNGDVLSPDFFGPGDVPQTGYAPGSLSGPVSIVVDGDDNVWIGNATGVLNEVSNSGVLLSPMTNPTGFNVSGYAISTSPTAAAAGMAIDRASRIWIANAGQDSLVEMSLDGVTLTPPPSGLTGGGLDGVTGGSNPPDSVAMDVFGNILTLNPESGTMSSFNSSDRSTVSPDGGYAIGGNPSAIFVDQQDKIYISQPQYNAIQMFDGLDPANGSFSIFYNPEVNGPAGIAGDASGNLWVANFGSGFSGSVTELVGLISPTITPLSVAASTVAFEP